MSRSTGLAAAAAALVMILAASGVRPYDRLTWLLEVLPGVHDRQIRAISAGVS